jgi:tetratricopeptide (TPR) repeat protein
MVKNPQYAVLGAVLTAVAIEMSVRYSEPDAVRTRAEVSPAGTSVPDPAPRSGHVHDFEYVRSVRYKDGSGEVLARGTPPKYELNRSELTKAAASLELEDFANAEKTYRGVLARTPDEVLAAGGLGTTLFMERRYDESRDVFQGLLEQDSRSFNARLGLGAVARVQERFADAVEEYSLALQDNPTFALSYFGRGVSYARLGNRAAAEADLNKTLELLPPFTELAHEARACIAELRQESPGIESQDRQDGLGAPSSVSEGAPQKQHRCR